MKREIGSFIELEFEKGREYYGGSSTVRLNSGRSGIYHAARCLRANTVYLPYYQCGTVREFLKKKGIQVKYYYIDEQFTPLLSGIEEEAAIVIVNYFGIFSKERLQTVAEAYKKVIIDHSQAFFGKPLENCMNVYSARKFIGVPDGGYVIGRGAEQFYGEYEEDFSSDTSQFLLMRIEYGCEGKAYHARAENEERIDHTDIRRMSELTRTILDGTDYQRIIRKRKENFAYAEKLFRDINQLSVSRYLQEDCVPMVYPLLVDEEGLLEGLLKEKHLQGHCWNYLTDEMGKDTWEYRLSKYMIPVTIDQRYGKQDLEYIREIVGRYL